MKRIVSAIMIATLLLGTFIITGHMQPVKGITITVPDDYSTIQAAVNAANDGDTVFVRSGTYVETVIINKRISLKGQSPESTVIDGDYGTAVSISADNVLVQGFTLESHTFSHGQIVYCECENSILRDNIIHYTVVYPADAVNRGVTMINARNNIIEDNRIEDIQENGILLMYSRDNIIRDNVITNTYWGIGLWADSSNNVVEGNTIVDTFWGYEEMQYHPGFPPVAGIAIWGSRDNLVTGNTVSNNSVIGIAMLGTASTNNSIVGNTISSNGHGSEVTWHDKPIVNSDVWVGEDIPLLSTLGKATGNIVYHNYFSNRSMVYCEHGGNIWDNGYPSGGNYWNDYDGVDVKKGSDQDQPGSDGIGDAPVVISDTNDQDRYPLMYPFGSPPPPEHTLEIGAVVDGTTDPASGNYTYSEGQSVPVQASPNLGYILEYWELDGANAGAANPLSVAMNTDHTVRPVFSWVGTHELTITTTAGGTTDPAPGADTYTKGTTVTVTAIPDSGYILDYWKLDGVNFGTSNPVNVVMDTNHVLYAAFTLTHILTITSTAGGTTTPVPGDYTYAAGTVVNVTAIPNIDDDYYFDHWEFDAVNNSSNPISITMNTDHTLKAVFALREYTLTVQATAGGTTSPAPGIHTYLSGSMVNVTGIPDTGYYLDYWELDGVKIRLLNSIIVPMTANRTLHITFKQLSLGHDVAIKDVASKTIVGQGYAANINALVMNVGSYTEKLNVTILINETSIASQDVTLESGVFTTMIFTWNTTGFAKGNYTISAIADSVPFETNLTDNTFTDGWIIVAMIGDIAGPEGYPDSKCDMRDVGMVARYFGKKVPPAPANCDLTGFIQRVPDGKVDMRDVGAVARHFGEKDP